MKTKKQMQDDEDAKNIILSVLRKSPGKKVAVGRKILSLSSAEPSEGIKPEKTEMQQDEIDNNTDMGLCRNDLVKLQDGKEYRIYKWDDILNKYKLGSRNWQSGQSVTIEDAVMLRSIMEYEATRPEAVSAAFWGESLHRGFMDISASKADLAKIYMGKESFAGIYDRNLLMFSNNKLTCKYWVSYVKKVKSCIDKGAEVAMGVDCFILGWHYSEMDSNGKISRNEELRKNFQHALPYSFYAKSK